MASREKHSLSCVETNPQVRERLDHARIEEMAASLMEHGQLSDIAVVLTDGIMALISSYRRLRRGKKGA
jgi:hypothetical protein